MWGRHSALRNAAAAALAVAFLAAALAHGAAAQSPLGACGEDRRIICFETETGVHVFNVEVADTPQETARGLMYRRSMPADAGMLFDFKRDRVANMWMKNTYIPLDMAFIRRDGTVAHIAHETQPHSLETISSGVEVRFVLEVNAGALAAAGIEVGARAQHPSFRD